MKYYRNCHIYFLFEISYNSYEIEGGGRAIKDCTKYEEKSIKLVVVIVMLVLAIFAGAFIYYNEGLKATGSNDDIVVVDVEEGTSFSGLLSELEEDGLIKNSFIGKIYLKISGTNMLQANTYELNKGMTLPEIIKVVETGDFNYLPKTKMTVPEGLTLPEVAEIVAKTTKASKEEVMEKWSDESYLNDLISEYWFLNAEDILQDGIKYPLEGYLYPETYTITSKEPTIEELTSMMLDFTAKAFEKYKDGMEALGFTPHEFLSFASVVERESLFDEDRPKIARVFLNRLDIDMNLESDITVLYALERTGVYVSYADLEVESGYNTYKYSGLPIGPISNVSDVTMKSCVDAKTNPEYESDYYFFYACPDGKVLYGRNMAEHEANIAANPWD